MTTLLSVNNYYYHRGGAETVFLEHNRLFAEYGWRVVPFAMHHPENLPTPWSRYFVDEIELGQCYSLAEKLVRVPKVIYSFEARRKLRALLLEVRPALCHAHNLYHHISPSILGLLHHHKIPAILTLHDLKIACPAYRMLASDGICERCRGGKIYNVSVHRCIKGSVAFSTIAMLEAGVHRLLGTYRRHVSRFVVPSRFYIRKFVEWGFDERLFSYVPNFVSVADFQPQYQPGHAFVFAGRLSPEKGVATLLKAAAKAKASLIVAGGGPELQSLRALADSLQVKADFVGHLSGEKLHQAMRNARAVIVPSEWYENAPMSVLEAYALGKPVIGSNIGGLSELVRESETGHTFPSGDVDALSARLGQFIDMPAGRIAAMGREARAWVAKEFSSECYRARILEVYRSAGVAA
jgi:glycosyltransferase involved in cell wall biosynthesis